MKRFGRWFGVALCAICVLLVVCTVMAGAKSRGDINEDSSIDMKDVLEVRKIVAGVSESYNAIAADMNGDSYIDMKDILILRKVVAGLPAEVAPWPEESTTSQTEITTSSSTQSSSSQVSTTTQNESSTQYTLTIEVQEEAPRYDTHTTVASWKVDAGKTVTFTVVLNIYDATLKTTDELKNYVSLTNCTVVGDPSVGTPVSRNSDVTYTYQVVMNSDVKVTGTIANPNFRPATFSADGEPSVTPTNPSQPTSSTTKVVTTTTTKQNTTKPSVVDGYLVQLDVMTEAPRYNNVHRTDYWEVEKNSTVNVEIAFLNVYRGNTQYQDWSAYVAPLVNGQSVSYEVSYSELVNEVCNVYFSFPMTITADTTITGKIQAPGNQLFVIRIDGEVGVGGITGGVEDVAVCNASPMVFDQVYLSYYDSNCSTYGVAWHTYKECDSPVVQYVKGIATSDADFSSAQSVTATSSLTTNGYIFADYNPLDGGKFTTTENVTNVPDYTHKAHLPKLDNQTTYSYRVGNASTGEFGEIYSITTRNPSETSFTFGYLSDSQWGENDPTNGTSYKKVLNSMTSIVSDPAFLMHGGDVVDVTKAIHLWGNQMGSNSSNFFAKVPTFAATGNHDEVNMLQTHFALESTTNYYSYDYQNTHFIVLDNGASSYDVTLGTEQLNWLKTDLATAKTKNYDWIIVSFHKPLYAPKQWNQNKDSYSVIAENAGKATRRDELTPIFVDGGVDLVLQAHTHQYGRTYPMTGVDTYQTDFTTTQENGYSYFSNVNGPIFTVFSTACNKPDPAIGTATGSYTSSSGTVYTENPYMAMASSGEKESFAVISIDSNHLSVAAYHDGTQAYEKFGIKK